MHCSIKLLWLHTKSLAAVTHCGLTRMDISLFPSLLFLIIIAHVSYPISGKKNVNPLLARRHSRGRVQFQTHSAPPKNTASDPYSGRIENGEDAVAHEFPWLISLRMSGWHICGGSILNAEYIVTAAHCLYDYQYEPDLFHIVAGEHNKRCDEGPEQFRKVVGIRIHEGYRDWSDWNDIAVIRIKPDLIFNEFVRPINLPPPGATEAQINTPTGVVAGWGLMDFYDNSTQPAMLRKLTQPQRTYKDCEDAYGYQRYDKVISVCYGGVNFEGPCKSDSGGPLLCGSKQTLCGIVSWAVKCAQLNLPTVYVKVTEYMDKFVRPSAKINPDAPIIDTCGGIFRGEEAIITFNDARSGDVCHWIIRADNVRNSFRFLGSHFVTGDRFFLTNISHICDDCTPVELNKYGETVTVGHPILVLTMMLNPDHTTYVRSFRIQFKSTTDTAKLDPLTEDDLLIKNQTEWFHPGYGYESYSNNDNLLAIIAPMSLKPYPVPRTQINISFILMDIFDEGTTPGCPGDHLVFFQQTTDPTTGVVKYKQSGQRYCGKTKPPNFVIPGNLAFGQFMSTPTSPLARGFSVRYAIDVRA